jgi:TrmH family RNA methyltransferase
VGFAGAITSPDNATIKYVRTIRDKKRVRYREKRYLVEGLRLVSQALDVGCRPALVFYDDEFVASPEGGELVEALVQSDATTVWHVTPELMADMSDTVTPQGVLAVYEMPDHPAAIARQATLLLVLDNVRDPGNAGTILRTALATQVDAALLSVGCVDAYSPKVVRAGMGAHYRLPIYPGLDWPAIEDLLVGKRVMLAEATGARTPWGLDWTIPCALVVSNEAHGASDPARALADSLVRLPMAEEIESLNVAIATAVFLFEAQRQRAALGGASPR